MFDLLGILRGLNGRGMRNLRVSFRVKKPLFGPETSSTSGTAAGPFLSENWVLGSVSYGGGSGSDSVAGVAFDDLNSDESTGGSSAFVEQR